jgi:two-component system sensor kinase FixL
MKETQRVLVIEDDEDTAANLRDILELDDFDVELAGTLHEALARDADDELAAVLVDRRLPDGNADDHLPEIRAIAPSSSTLIITGHADLDGAVAALRQGADDYLLKPIDPETLRAALARSVEHRRTRLALRESTLRSDAILNGALDGIITIDEAGVIVSVNRAADRIFGYEEGELIGQNVNALIPPPDREKHDAYLAEYLKTGDGSIVGSLREVPGLRKNGSEFLHEISVSEVKLAKHRLFTATVRDLTERNRVRKALRESERRARLAEDLASIGTLAAGLAHEVGTPMNVILGYAQMIHASVKDEATRERARIIREQVQRVSQIIQTLLNFARPGERSRGSVDLVEVVEATLSLLQERFRTHGIEVVRRFEALPEVWADDEKLQQLFINLGINAADAMPDGGTLAIHMTPRNSAEVEIRVADTGTGIAADVLPHLFEPFYTTKERGEGVGLGLAVVKGIVVDHGGSIDVSSEVGKGTEFCVVLPIATPEE